VADVIVVLGGALINSSILKQVEQRVTKAFQLYRAGNAKYIIFSGGYTRGSAQSEAAYMQQVAMRYGVPKRSIILEENAKTTVGNIIYSQRIMKQRGWHTAIVITSPHHVLRTKNIIAKADKTLRMTVVACEGLPLQQAIPEYLRNFYQHIKYWRQPLSRARL